MAASVDAKLIVGDRQRSLRATLKIQNADGSKSLATLTAVTLLMVPVTGGTPKINYAACTIEGPGVVRYDWLAGDVDTAGKFNIRFRDIDGTGKPQHWPEDYTYTLQWVGAADA